MTPPDSGNSIIIPHSPREGKHAWCSCSLIHQNLFNLILKEAGLPWWLSDKESACRNRRLRFSPWFGKIPLKEEMLTHSNILA